MGCPSSARLVNGRGTSMGQRKMALSSSGGAALLFPVTLILAARKLSTAGIIIAIGPQAVLFPSVIYISSYIQANNRSTLILRVG